MNGARLGKQAVAQPGAGAHLVAAVVALLALTALGRSALAGEGPPAWWNDQWIYRLTVRAVPAERRADINTARLELAEQSALCAPEGRDVRVFDDAGRPVPHQVELTEDKTLAVKFLAPPTCEVFRIYYGNANAPAVKYNWQEQLGGLTLETRRLWTTDAKPRPYPAYHAAEIPALLQQNFKSYGKKDWRQINDLENPFGESDFYLSIYEGTIYCPDEGVYTFSLNADDIASFYLMMGKTLLLNCWRDTDVPSEEWPAPMDPKHPNATKTTEEPLLPGVYRIYYYHVEDGGAQLAKLGWKEPSSEGIVTVPPSAFVRYLPAEIESREKRGESLNPFFVTRHRYNLLVNGEDLRFPCYYIESRSGEPKGTASPFTYRWDFADGTTGAERAADHEFPEMKPYDVTLAVKDAAGHEASVTRHVVHPADPVKRMTLRMQVQFQSDMPILPAGGTASLRLLLKNDSTIPRPIVLETVSEAETNVKQASVVDKQLIEDLKPIPGLEEGWLSVHKLVTLPKDNLYLTFRLLLHGRPTVENKLAALSTDRPLGQLTQDSAHNLRDEKGRLVVLRLADVTLKDVPARKLCDERTGQVNVLVFDEALAGPGTADQQSSYVRFLADSLNDSYPALHFKMERPAFKMGDEFPPIRRFLETYRHALKAQPNMVVLVCQPESVVDTIPQDAFETYLVAAVDQILSQTRAQVVLVSPPPLAGRPELARAYARIAKKTGLRKGLVVSDLYSRFMLTPRWEDLFKPAGGEDPAYQLSPNEKGQRLMSQEIFTSIVSGLHNELSDAARAISLSREESAAPPSGR